MGFQAAFTCAEKVNVLPNKGGDLDWLYTLGRYNRAHGASSQAFLKPILDQAEPHELEQRASFDAFFNGRVAKRSLRILVIRKTMVSGAQSPKFACVR